MTDQTKRMNPLMLIFFLLLIIGAPMLPLLITGQWDWWEAWVYAGLNILGFALSRYLAGRQHPDLIAERGQAFQHQDPEPWDKILFPLLMIMGILMPLLAGLEQRNGLSNQFGLPLKMLSIVLIIFGYGIGAYALITNRFFSGVVRIQTERGHHVIDQGPYRWVRHPGYSGAFITHLVIPLLLDSWWAFVPAVLALFIIILRTALEDRALQDKLPGYSDYAQRVRYRLLPGIW